MHTKQPVLQHHGQREGCCEQRQGCRRKFNSPPYSAMVNERDVTSNGKDADTHRTAHPTEPWPTRGMWQATARMPMYTQQPTLQRHGQREGCYEQRQGCQRPPNSPHLQRHGQREGCCEQRQECRCTPNSLPYSSINNESADAHQTAHPTSS